MIVAVLEHCENDSDAMFFIDMSKLNLKSRMQKQYHDAIMACIENDRKESQGIEVSIKEHEKTYTGTNVAFNYQSTEWKLAEVNPPCQVDAVATIWEGLASGR